MMDFGLKEKNGELFVKTDYSIPPKVYKKRIPTKWKLLESLFDLDGKECLFIVEPKQRTKKIPIFTDTNSQRTFVPLTKNITLVDLVRTHNLETLIPQISLAIEKLNQIID